MIGKIRDFIRYPFPQRNHEQSGIAQRGGFAVGQRRVSRRRPAIVAADKTDAGLFDRGGKIRVILRAIHSNQIGHRRSFRFRLQTKYEDAGVFAVVQQQDASNEMGRSAPTCPGRGGAFFTLLRESRGRPSAYFVTRRRLCSAAQAALRCVWGARLCPPKRTRAGSSSRPSACRHRTVVHAAFWACASMSSAAFTFGRAATRSLNAIRFLNSDKSMPVRSAHFSITNR